MITRTDDSMKYRWQVEGQMGQDNVRQGEDIANSSSMNAWRVPKTEVVGDGPKIVGRTKGERGGLERPDGNQLKE
jgi:hypothetical protein